MNNNHINLSAYDNIENLENFTDEQFINYCNNKLIGCEKHLHFINNLDLPKKIDICEIGSGNSKLLYKLEMAERINKAIGIEISKSRYQFAEKFKKYINSSRVENLNQNVFDMDFQIEFDLIIAVDIVLQLIVPISNNSEEKIMNWIYNNLKENGYIVFELWTFLSILEQLNLSNNSLKLWDEFPNSDPFKYILSDIKIDEDDNIIWKKRFIKRDSYEESNFNNILKPYKKEEISDILLKYGFRDIEIFDCWKEQNDTDKDEFIIVARK